MKYLLVKCRGCGAVFIDEIGYIEVGVCFCPLCQNRIVLAEIGDFDKRRM